MYNDYTRRPEAWPIRTVSSPVLLLLYPNETVVALALALVNEVEPLADLVHQPTLEAVHAGREVVRPFGRSGEGAQLLRLRRAEGLVALLPAAAAAAAAAAAPLHPPPLAAALARRRRRRPVDLGEGGVGAERQLELH
eukprot:scaffold45308_cov63-Phaeocystis_antarctica.AAC.1